MNSHTLILAAAVMAAASLNVAAQGSSGEFEYLITNTDMSTKGAEADKYVEMTLDIRSIHDLSADVRFVVFGLIAKLETADGTTTIPMNRYAVKTHEERFQLPLGARIDEVIVAKWFDAPLPQRTQREYRILVPTNGRVIGAALRSREVQLIDGTLGQPIITISFRTISVGHHARDALPLLGNPLLPIELRRDLARQVSLAERKRYRFLDDAGSWIQSGGLDSSMPEATLAEQAAGGVLTDVGPSEAGGGIRAHNALSRIIYVGVAGEGQRVWEKVEPGKTVFFGIPPGLFALTTWDRGYVTRNVHLAPKRLYDFRIRG